MKRTFAFLMVLVLAFGAMFAGCDNAETPDDSTLKAACILGVGGLGDQGFNDLVYEGMERAKAELGVDFDYAEPKQISDFEQIMRDMSSSGEYIVIVCVGFDQMDALSIVAPDYPEQNFAFIDGALEGDNIVSYSCREQEGSFLVGAMEIDTIVRFGAGYAAGAKYVNPDIEVDIRTSAATTSSVIPLPPKRSP